MSANNRIKNVFPGLAEFDSAAGFLDEMRDPHSIILGEVNRSMHLLVRLRQVEREGQRDQMDEREIATRKFKALHDWYRLMYGLRASEWRVDQTRLVQACEDVERDVDELVRMLPKSLHCEGRSWRIQSELHGPDEVRECNDVIKLLDLWRHPLPENEQERVYVTNLRRRARFKLVAAQFYFERYRCEQDLGHLRERARTIRELFEEVLFDRHSGESVYVVAELDPFKGYTCTSWKVQPNLPERDTSGHRAVIKAKRYWLRHGEQRIPVYFFVRPKDHLFLKALVKGTRFLELKGIGDLIGLSFIVEAEHVDLLVATLRRHFVNAPGMVCDQGSSMGDRLSKPDASNKHTSDGYKVMKYSALIDGQIVEIQFQAGNNWIDDHCEHSDRNHGSYKLRRYLESVLPLIAPAIPWHEAGFQVLCIEHLLSNLSRDWL